MGGRLTRNYSQSARKSRISAGVGSVRLSGGGVLDKFIAQIRSVLGVKAQNSSVERAGPRILYFLDPVAFRQDPACLVPHFAWVRLVQQVADVMGGQAALAANAVVCEQWRQDAAEGEERLCFELPTHAPLEPFAYRRSDYARALYGAGDEPNALTDALSEVRAAYAPDIVVTTCQNAFAQKAFAGIPMLYVEQAPIPRLRQYLKTYFDPSGHQTGSLLETRAADIKSIRLPPEDWQELSTFPDRIRNDIYAQHEAYPQARAAFDEIRRHGKVALLATQPPDWPTYEGAYDGAVPVEDLLYAWGQLLPEGWIGVPTYHLHFRLTAGMEAALAKACPKLRFLPEHLSQGLTELYIPEADGMITISSTSAATALLFRKKVVVCGKSPFTAWCGREVEDIEAVVPPTQDEATALLAFLSNRYCYLHEDLVADPSILTKIFTVAMTMDDPGQWFFDMSGWSLDRAKAVFGLQPTIAAPAPADA